MKALVVYGRDSYGVDAVGIAVKITLITGQRAISTGEYEYGALSMSSVLDTIEEGLVNDVIWSVHGLAIIRGPPAAGVNVDIREAIVECCSFVCVRDWAREDAHACYLCFISEADAADVVLRSCDLAGAAGTMTVVCKEWFRKGCVAVKVVGMFSVLRE